MTTYFVAYADATIQLNNGDTKKKVIEDTFGLVQTPPDLLQKMVTKVFDRAEPEEVAYLYSYWLRNLPGLSSIDHYLSDTEDTTEEVSSEANLESLHLKELDEWLAKHKGWHFSIRMTDDDELVFV